MVVVVVGVVVVGVVGVVVVVGVVSVGGGGGGRTRGCAHAPQSHPHQAKLTVFPSSRLLIWIPVLKLKKVLSSILTTKRTFAVPHGVS